MHKLTPSTQSVNISRCGYSTDRHYSAIRLIRMEHFWHCVESDVLMLRHETYSWFSKQLENTAALYEWKYYVRMEWKCSQATIGVSRALRYNPNDSTTIRKQHLSIQSLSERVDCRMLPSFVHINRRICNRASHTWMQWIPLINCVYPMNVYFIIQNIHNVNLTQMKMDTWTVLSYGHHVDRRRRHVHMATDHT